VGGARKSNHEGTLRAPNKNAPATVPGGEDATLSEVLLVVLRKAENVVGLKNDHIPIEVTRIPASVLINKAQEDLVSEQAAVASEADTHPCPFPHPGPSALSGTSPVGRGIN